MNRGQFLSTAVPLLGASIVTLAAQPAATGSDEPGIEEANQAWGGDLKYQP
jgi:hypothetical protein